MIQWTENVETNGNENCFEAQKYEIKKVSIKRNF
jgi:hypothetical protein